MNFCTLRLVMKKDDLFVFVVSIHFRKSFQASFADSSGESGCEKGGFNDQSNCGIDNIEIVSHNLCLKLNKMIGNTKPTVKL